MNKQELIDAISNMTVLELADLVKALEEKFGVSAAAPMAVAAPVATATAEAAPVEEEEKTEFDVVLKAVGENKIQVIKVVRELTNLGLREAKAVVDEAPSDVMKAVSKEQAATAKAKLEEVGAQVDVR